MISEIVVETVKSTIHHLLHCPSFSIERLTLFSKLQTTDENDSNISKVLLFDEQPFNDVKNTSV